MMTETKTQACSPKERAILDAALSLFLANGYGQTSMEAIAKKAGVAKQTVYSYFSSKEQLFSAIMCSHCSSIDMFRDPKADAVPEITLPRLAEDILSMLMNPQRLALYRVVITESANLPTLGHTFFENGPHRGISMLADYLARQTAEGKLNVSNPKLAAEYFLAMVANFPQLEALLDVSPPLTAEQRKQRAQDVSTDFLRMFKV